MGRPFSWSRHAVEMGVNVIDADQRFAQRPGEGFGGGYAYQEAADQAGAVGYGDGVDVR